MSDSIFKPHNLKANQVATPESIALYDAAKQADLSKVSNPPSNTIIGEGTTLVTHHPSAFFFVLGLVSSMITS